VTDKSGPFWEFVHRRGVGVIVLDSQLSRDPAFRNDQEFQDFLSGRRTEDFTLVPVPNVPIRIAVRNDLSRQ
jgi:hypothetical protein